MSINIFQNLFKNCLEVSKIIGKSFTRVYTQRDKIFKNFKNIYNILVGNEPRQDIQRLETSGNIEYPYGQLCLYKPRSYGDYLNYKTNEQVIRYIDACIILNKYELHQIAPYSSGLLKQAWHGLYDNKKDGRERNVKNLTLQELKILTAILNNHVTTEGLSKSIAVIPIKDEIVLKASVIRVKLGQLVEKLQKIHPQKRIKVVVSADESAEYERLQSELDVAAEIAASRQLEYITSNNATLPRNKNASNKSKAIVMRSPTNDPQNQHSKHQKNISQEHGLTIKTQEVEMKTGENVLHKYTPKLLEPASERSALEYTSSSEVAALKSKFYKGNLLVYNTRNVILAAFSNYLWNDDLNRRFHLCCGIQKLKSETDLRPKNSEKYKSSLVAYTGGNTSLAIKSANKRLEKTVFLRNVKYIKNVFYRQITDSSAMEAYRNKIVRNYINRLSSRLESTFKDPSCNNEPRKNYGIDRKNLKERFPSLEFHTMQKETILSDNDCSFERFPFVLLKCPPQYTKEQQKLIGYGKEYVERPKKTQSTVTVTAELITETKIGKINDNTADKIDGQKSVENLTVSKAIVKELSDENLNTNSKNKVMQDENKQGKIIDIRAEEKEGNAEKVGTTFAENGKSTEGNVSGKENAKKKKAGKTKMPYWLLGKEHSKEIKKNSVPKKSLSQLVTMGGAVNETKKQSKIMQTGATQEINVVEAANDKKEEIKDTNEHKDTVSKERTLECEDKIVKALLKHEVKLSENEETEVKFKDDYEKPEKQKTERDAEKKRECAENKILKNLFGSRKISDVELTEQDHIEIKNKATDLNLKTGDCSNKGAISENKVFKSTESQKLVKNQKLATDCSAKSKDKIAKNISFEKILKEMKRTDSAKMNKIPHKKMFKPADNTKTGTEQFRKSGNSETKAIHNRVPSKTETHEKLISEKAASKCVVSTGYKPDFHGENMEKFKKELYKVKIEVNSREKQRTVEFTTVRQGLSRSKTEKTNNSVLGDKLDFKRDKKDMISKEKKSAVLFGNNSKEKSSGTNKEHCADPAIFSKEVSSRYVIEKPSNAEKKHKHCERLSFIKGRIVNAFGETNIRNKPMKNQGKTYAKMPIDDNVPDDCKELNKGEHEANDTHRRHQKFASKEIISSMESEQLKTQHLKERECNKRSKFTKTSRPEQLQSSFELVLNAIELKANRPIIVYPKNHFRLDKIQDPILLDLKAINLKPAKEDSEQRADNDTNKELEPLSKEAKTTTTERTNSRDGSRESRGGEKTDNTFASTATVSFKAVDINSSDPQSENQPETIESDRQSKSPREEIVTITLGSAFNKTSVSNEIIIEPFENDSMFDENSMKQQLTTTSLEVANVPLLPQDIHKKFIRQKYYRGVSFEELKEKNQTENTIESKFVNLSERHEKDNNNKSLLDIDSAQAIEHKFETENKNFKTSNTKIEFNTFQEDKIHHESTVVQENISNDDKRIVYKSVHLPLEIHTKFISQPYYLKHIARDKSCDVSETNRKLDKDESKPRKILPLDIHKKFISQAYYLEHIKNNKFKDKDQENEPNDFKGTKYSLPHFPLEIHKKFISQRFYMRHVQDNIVDVNTENRQPKYAAPQVPMEAHKKFIAQNYYLNQIDVGLQRSVDQEKETMSSRKRNEQFKSKQSESTLLFPNENSQMENVGFIRNKNSVLPDAEMSKETVTAEEQYLGKKLSENQFIRTEPVKISEKAKEEESTDISKASNVFKIKDILEKSSLFKYRANSFTVSKPLQPAKNQIENIKNNCRWSTEFEKKLKIDNKVENEELVYRKRIRRQKSISSRSITPEQSENLLNFKIGEPEQPYMKEKIVVISQTDSKEPSIQKFTAKVLYRKVSDIFEKQHDGSHLELEPNTSHKKRIKELKSFARRTNRTYFEIEQSKSRFRLLHKEIKENDQEGNKNDLVKTATENINKIRKNYRKPTSAQPPQTNKSASGFHSSTEAKIKSRTRKKEKV